MRNIGCGKVTHSWSRSFFSFLLLYQFNIHVLAIPPKDSLLKLNTLVFQKRSSIQQKQDTIYKIEDHITWIFKQKIIQIDDLS